MSASEDLWNTIPTMTPEERFATLLSVAEECIAEDELLPLLHAKHSPICYVDFEPSGCVHISQAIRTAININRMVRAGCKVKILASAKNMNKVRPIGRYMIEIWTSLGINLEKVEFIWSPEQANDRAHEYWPLVMDIARRNTVKRLMGLQANPVHVTATKLLDPIMRCADMLLMEVDICLVGTDQREVTIMAREYCECIGKNKPIILLHHMLTSFKEGQKMSKSDPSLDILMDDSESSVKLKIRKTFCPIKIVEGNICLEYIEHIVFPWLEKFDIIRHESNGGNRTYHGMEELIVDYRSGALHPGDVKTSLAKAINEMLQPVREHINKNNEAKVLHNIVKKYLATNPA